LIGKTIKSPSDASAKKMLFNGYIGLTGFLRPMKDLASGGKSDGKIEP